MSKKVHIIILSLVLLLTAAISCGGSRKRKKANKRETIAYIKELKVQVEDYYKRIRIVDDADKAREKTLQWVLEREKVKKAGIDNDKDTIWIILENGIEVDVIAK